MIIVKYRRHFTLLVNASLAFISIDVWYTHLTKSPCFFTVRIIIFLTSASHRINNRKRLTHVFIETEQDNNFDHFKIENCFFEAVGVIIGSSIKPNQHKKFSLSEQKMSKSKSLKRSVYVLAIVLRT